MITVERTKQGRQIDESFDVLVKRDMARLYALIGVNITTELNALNIRYIRRRYSAYFADEKTIQICKFDDPLITVHEVGHYLCRTWHGDFAEASPYFQNEAAADLPIFMLAHCGHLPAMKWVKTIPHKDVTKEGQIHAFHIFRLNKGKPLPELMRLALNPLFPTTNPQRSKT